MLNHWLHYLLFAFTMFAAGAPPLGDSGGGGSEGAGAGEGAGGEGNVDLGDEGAGEGGDDLEQFGEDLDAAEQQRQQQARKQGEDKETGDLKGLVSRRLMALKKEAPELTEIFKTHPKVQEQIEAAFRRDMAYRELYPTVAEARAIREHFPNGVADVEQMLGELGEMEQLDQNFYGKDAQGNYAGHGTLIQNLFTDDRAATVGLFRTLPKEWARLDPDSYNEVMGNIVGATILRAELPEWLTELRDTAKEAKQDALAASLDKMLRWATGFIKQKAQPTENERQLQAREEQFRREQSERQLQDVTRFKTTFYSESDKLQQGIIRKHPAVADMLQQKSISDDKKRKIVTEVQTRIREYLKDSRGFMSKLRPAYNSGNLDECIKLQKAQWSYPWVLNKVVRQVLAEETPNLVRQNRERVRGAAQSQRLPAARSGQRPQGQQPQKHTKPYQAGKQWFKPDGSKFTTSEILRGLHLQGA